MPRPRSREIATDWMHHIGDDRFLTELTIPGTHDTMTYLAENDSVMEGRNLSLCQHLPLKDQLNRGIRFIDVRLYASLDYGGQNLVLCHGSVSLNHTFDYVLSECCKFLAEHTSECIIMSINNDRRKDDNVKLFSELVSASVSDPRYRDFFYTEKKIPKLGRVRRRIVLLRRFDDSEVGINVTDWPGDQTFERKNSDGVVYNVQDEFDAWGYATLGRKYDHWKKQALNAAQDQIKDKLYINFSSGTGGAPAAIKMTPTPEYIADSVNPRLLDFFSEATPARYGVIPMDFPEALLKPANLISTIISTNVADRVVDGGIYELRPKLAPDSALTVYGRENDYYRDVGISKAQSSDNQRWLLGDIDRDGYFCLAPLSVSDLALSVRDGSTSDGAAITLDDPSHQDYLRWKLETRPDGLVTLSPKNAPGSVLDVYGGSRADGTLVKLYHYYPPQNGNNAYSERWQLVRVG
ncbi:phosphatidylinositol-specific phospholipase C domain-containing protein [Rhizobium mayense]|uniref:1-phosphatidylinositol phosphodiesterase n=1 Tax=Rhizobium mayense TaxID=1312184 RepID=A0ABT7JWS0_9HYPH|nr:phosphatidylinositol-specific phospholipase C domain-containing protein [Rhizobium mayense]MDL2400798.1 phosphatidylinositol-specific phospholipase C domain-containing protein [Rhizobium mayense]